MAKPNVILEKSYNFSILILENCWQIQKEKKEEIKAINPKGQKYDLYKPFIWNRKKGMWYCSPKSYKGGSSGKSHDYIRSKYGATTYQGKKDNAEVIAR